MSTKVVTGEGRFSFPSVFKPRENSGKYEVTLLIPKTDKATIKACKAAIKEAAELGKDSKFNGKIPKNLYNPLRDGDEDRADEYPEFAGHYFISARSTRRPGLVDADRNAIIDETLVYPGVYGRLQVNFYPFSQDGNRGIAVGLENIQVLRDGEPFGATRAKASDVFDDGFEVQDNDDDDDDEIL